jgi:hypothetical protein
MLLLSNMALPSEAVPKDCSQMIRSYWEEEGKEERKEERKVGLGRMLWLQI